MKLKIMNNYEELSEEAANIITERIKEKPSLALGVAAGSTPLLLYKKLGERCQRGEVDFSCVRVFCLDVYIGLLPTDPHSFRRSMEENLFSRVNLKKEHINLMDGMAVDIAAECARYDDAVKAVGGLDFLVLGIGTNAHIGFNEPDEVFVADTHVVELSEATRTANARFFENPDDTPSWAISMGIKDIMMTSEVMLMASGASKTEAVYKAVCGDITPFAPASVLQLHRNAHFYLDKAAASRIPEELIKEK